MTILSGAQVAKLVQQAGFSAGDQVTMVAIAKAESGWNTQATNHNSNGSTDRGLFQINSIHGYDPRRLFDAAYNTECAKSIRDRQGLSAWTVYNTGRWRRYEGEARRAVAQAGQVRGSPVTAGSGSNARPSVTYGPPGPEYVTAGVGTPLAAAEQTEHPLAAIRILGSEIGGDYASAVIGAPSYEAAMDEIPNLALTILDPEGDLLWKHRNVWVKGARIEHEDLSFRIDEHSFEPGSHGTGQIEITAIDDIVFALRNLKGPRTAHGISATEWIAQEMRQAGINPDEWLLGESVPTQSEISRDAPSTSGMSGAQGEEPSAWTTILRLGKELGKWVFISGKRLIFGSAAFAQRWAAPGPLRLSWHELEWSERFLTMPSASWKSVGDKQVKEVTGRIPFNRAKYFRPGCPVIIRNVPAVAAGAWIAFMVTDVSYDLGTDTDGAEVTLVQPYDEPPQPPQTSSAELNGGPTGNGASVSGGGTDSQVDRVVALCLQQAGDRYVFGAEASPSEPNPRAFDCCLTGDTLITTTRGQVPIKDVATGDTVLSWKRSGLCYRPVTAVAEQGVQDIFTVASEDGHAVRASANHPFLVMCPDKRHVWRMEWLRVDRLAPGMLLVGYDNGRFTTSLCTSVTPSGREMTWDVEISGSHNYIAGGLVVHNSELVEWACARAGVNPRMPDGSSAQRSHCARHGTLISVNAGINTKGALLFSPGHVALSLGNGRVIEAANPSDGVLQDTARGRGWTAAGRIPGAKGYR